MQKEQVQQLYILLAASVASWLIPALWALGHRCIRQIRNKPYRYSGISWTMIASVCLLFATWCIRFAVSWSQPLEGECGLTGWEKLASSFLHTLQTFSMDEDYTVYITQGKAMIGELGLKDQAFWQGVYGIYASALNVLAPVVGGAFIFDILAGIFPKLRLAGACRVPWREKIFFSELNEASATLAASIFDYYTHDLKKPRPVLIFTDTYVDSDNEKRNELLMEVRRVGAICVRDDLAHVRKAGWGKRKYYLIDANEQGNLKTFVNLAEGKNIRYVKKAEIYLFVESDAYVRLEKQIREKLLSSSVFKRTRSHKHLPRINPVRVYRNLIHNLLVEVPLYEPIVPMAAEETSAQAAEKETQPNRTLTVTVLGNGIIGTEAFLDVYWMGQMLDTTLRIQVISKDTEKEFWDKIDYINPEIRKTVEELRGKQEEKKTKDSILRYNEHDFNDAYCQVRYAQKDVRIGAFWDEMLTAGQEENTAQLLKTDYYIIALGSDADNIAVSEKVRCLIGKQAMESGETSRTVIAYAVFDSALCDTLNEKRYHHTLHKEKTDIYMYAFGSLKQVYGCENLLMTKHKLWAEETGLAYARAKQAMNFAKANQERGRDESADYTYWADLARAMHIKYKVFSLGWIQSSLFDYQNEKEADTGHRKHVQDACARFKRIAIKADGKEDVVLKREMEEKKEQLAWLEHRRWNAYTRTMGYQQTDAMEANYRRHGSHKNMRLKLHPCLVESAKPSPKRSDRPDLLDEVARYWEQVSLRRNVDFKKYDSYDYEYDSYDTVESASKEWKMPKWLVKWMCAHGKVKNAIGFSEPKQWYIPQNTVLEGLLFWYRSYGQIAQRLECAVQTVEKYCARKYAEQRNYGGTTLVPWYRALAIQNVLKGKLKMYKPEPIDTSKIELPQEIQGLMEQLAENVHENWAASRMEEGWTYGEARDDKKKTTPCMVPYAELSEQEKHYDRKTALETLRTILALGYRIEKIQPTQEDGE